MCEIIFTRGKSFTTFNASDFPGWVDAVCVKMRNHSDIVTFDRKSEHQTTDSIPNTKNQRKTKMGKKKKLCEKNGSPGLD